MIKKGLKVLILIFAIFSAINLNIFQCFGSSSDVHFKPNKIYLFNTYYSGLFLETANINLKNRTIEINYQPRDPGDVKLVNLNIGEIIGFNKDIRVIQTIQIENNKELGLKQDYIQEKYPLKEFKAGMTIILWVGNVTSKYDHFVALTKEQLLERARAIWWEQYRLTNVRGDMGQEELNREVTRNYEE